MNEPMGLDVPQEIVESDIGRIGRALPEDHDEPGDVQTVLGDAHQILRDGDLGTASRLYLKVLESHPSNAVALHQLGFICSRQGDYAGAVGYFVQAIVSKPNNAVFHINLGEAYRNLGQLHRSLGCCRLALRLQPNFPDGMLTLGRVYLDLRQYAEAAEEFRRALSLRPDLAAAHNNLGLALQELGYGEEAIVHFCRAVELSPDSVQIRTNLGLALLNNGRPEEALSHFVTALRSQSETAPLHFNVGRALKELNRLDEARSAFLESVRLDPDWVPPYLQIGVTLWHGARLKEALTWYELGAQLKPDDYLIWEQMGDLHREMDDLEESIACWQRAISLSSTERGAAHLGLGLALRDNGQFAEAMEHFESALKLEPGEKGALIHMGGVHEEVGNLEDAENVYRKALDEEPENAIALSRLGTLLRGKLADGDVVAIEGRLADPGLNSHHRCRLLFALAHIFDARGQYSEAAQCLREANELAILASPDRLKYEPREHSKFINRMEEVFNRKFYEQLAGLGSTSRLPIFVLGLPRSGTTLVEQILGSHPLVHGAGELRLARRSFEGIPSKVGVLRSPLDCVSQLNGEIIAAIAQEHLEKLLRLGQGSLKYIIDKMPENYAYIPFLSLLFPNATFIHCSRDLRDVAVSCWMTDFGKIRWANRFDHIAERFADYVRIMGVWKSLLPALIYDISYEELVDDTERVTRDLLMRCGLEWEPRCLEFHRNQRPVRTASVMQVRQPIYHKSVERWKNYEVELEDLLNALPRMEL